MGCAQSAPEEPAQPGPNTLSSLRAQPTPVVERAPVVEAAAGVSAPRRPLPALPIESMLMGLETPAEPKEVEPEFSTTPETISKVSAFTYRRGNNFKWKGKYLAKLVKPYDGDTGTFILDNEVQLSLRLARIDTPELNMNTMPQEWKRSERIIEKEEAEASLNKLIELIGPSGLVVASLQGSDKYGRTLAELYSFHNNEVGESINQQMLDLHYAIPYDGGQKQAKVGELLRRLRNA